MQARLRSPPAQTSGRPLQEGLGPGCAQLSRHCNGGGGGGGRRRRLGRGEGKKRCEADRHADKHADRQTGCVGCVGQVVECTTNLRGPKPAAVAARTATSYVVFACRHDTFVCVASNDAVSDPRSSVTAVSPATTTSYAERRPFVVAGAAHDTRSTESLTATTSGAATGPGAASSVSTVCMQMKGGGCV